MQGKTETAAEKGEVDLRLPREGPGQLRPSSNSVLHIKNSRTPRPVLADSVPKSSAKFETAFFRKQEGIACPRRHHRVERDMENDHVVDDGGAMTSG